MASQSHILKRNTEAEIGELQTPQALQMAFEAFNELSTELSNSYQALESRVEHLTREAELANEQRLRELAEKERLASRLQNLLQLLPGGVVVLNKQGRVSECNRAARELLGEPLLSLHWRDIISQRFAPREDDGHEISLRDGRRVSLLTRSLDDEPGQIILVTDQTETRRLQQHLSRHQRLSEMGRMVSSLAHQIRTPLSAAMLYAGHLGSEAMDQEQRGRTVNKLNARLHNMERQVKDMLIFARGDAVLDETLPVSALLAETRTAAEVLLRSGQQQCDWHDNSQGAQISCNKESLIGALLNLIENALQNAGSGAQLQIVAELQHSDSGTRQLSLYVRDNGPGIDAALLEQITEPFFTTRAQGTGLGLAVAQVVARAHQGEFFIESETAEESPVASGTKTSGPKTSGTKTSGTTAGFTLPLNADTTSGSQQ